MKVLVTHRSEKAAENRNYRGALKIEIDGVKKFRVSDGEPEDSNLARAFSDCYDIIHMIKEAHLAGSRGELLEIEEVDSDDI